MYLCRANKRSIDLTIYWVSPSNRPIDGPVKAYPDVGLKKDRGEGEEDEGGGMGHLERVVLLLTLRSVIDMMRCKLQATANNADLSLIDLSADLSSSLRPVRQSTALPASMSHYIDSVQKAVSLSLSLSLSPRCWSSLGASFLICMWQRCTDVQIVSLDRCQAAMMIKIKKN